MTDKPLSWCVFDCETSGLVAPDLYVLTVWDSVTNWTYNFTADAVHQGVELIESSEVAISWNGQRYDRDVLERAAGRNMVMPRQIDLWRYLIRGRPDFERGWRLEDVALRLFNESKGQPSSLIPELWAQGRHLQVLLHCSRDVYLTRSVFEHIRDKQWMIDPYGGVVQLEVPEWWQRLRLPESGVPTAEGHVL